MRQDVRADQVEVGDILIGWGGGITDMQVTEVKRLSVSVAITAQQVGKVGPNLGSAQWHLDNWYALSIERPYTADEQAIHCECGWSRIILDGETAADAYRAHSGTVVHSMDSK